MSVSKQDVIGDVHDIVDRTQANHTQVVLQPFWALLHSNALDGDASITRTSFTVHDGHIDI